MATLQELVEHMVGSRQLNELDSGIRVIDSHTEGEPTRVVLSGGPDLGDGPMCERLQRFRETADDFRSALILEPRGSEALVGALLCEPVDSTCAAGVIYFNNAGYLGMCGHGTIGVAVTLAYLGRLGIGTHRLETPVGVVEVKLLSANEVARNGCRRYCLGRELVLSRREVAVRADRRQYPPAQRCRSSSAVGFATSADHRS